MKIALSPRRLTRNLACAFAAALSGVALAATTDISSAPMASSSDVAVKPNILFILDNSGSMESLFMPDEVSGDLNHTGFRNSSCNTIYYNPATTYSPPKNADGTDFANATFSGAKTNGYSSTSTTVDLRSAFSAHDGDRSTSADTAQAAYYWSYSGSDPLIPTQGACEDTISSSSTTSITSRSSYGGTWTKVAVSATTAPSGVDGFVNFANWYSFYRTRIMMMKAAASRTFSQLTSDYRVGFLVIEPYRSGRDTSIGSDDFVPIGDFDTTKKTTWFSTLFSQTGTTYTPLRRALSRAGRYFAGVKDGINTGMSDDPVQYSCQQNFAILTTDGYWNSEGGQKLDGSDMDNQDNNIAVTPRPLYDGSLTTVTDTVTQTVYSWGSSCGRVAGQRSVEYVTTTTTTTTVYNTDGTILSGPTSDTPAGSVRTIRSGRSTACFTYDSGGPVLHPLTTDRNGDAFAAGSTNTVIESSTSGVVATSGGSVGSLADVAQYYYRGAYDRGSGLFSLRAAGATGAGGADVGTDCNVPATGTGIEDDKNTCQHMTTFTMGLGITGTVGYRSDYKTATTGDFMHLRNGSTTLPSACSSTFTTCPNWPTAVENDPTALDDLWHAAVNGRGRFFSASNPDAVVKGLNEALAGINARVSSAAAAATSNLEPVAGDNFAYVGKYDTQKWTGEIEAHEIDLSTGVVSSTVIWSAQTKLDAKVGTDCDDRTIKLFHSGSTYNLVNFTWNTKACASGTTDAGTLSSTLSAADLTAYFGSTAVNALTQASHLTSTQLSAAGSGPTLVNYLRGQKNNEGYAVDNPATSTFYFRTREHALGDIVNAQPVYVRSPFASYTDKGYGVFKGTGAGGAGGRAPMVYVAANDGMLHAFYAGTSVSDTTGGNEAWAIIPSMVLPNMYKLADANYATLHQWLADGTPTVGDVCTANCTVTSADPLTEPAATWKTILVAGLNGGGKGYYAIDVTDPANPKGLWEFKYSATCYDSTIPATAYADCDLGLSFGNPIISKLDDGHGTGEWVVFLTSGYNNASGLGFLYVIQANTGKILYKIGTGAGDATTPSGLNKINNWVTSTLTDNSTQRVYGVDVLGNVWRFDVNDIIPPTGREATRIATVMDDADVPQPITTRPELAAIGSPPEPYVYVGTGKYLGTADIPALGSTPQTQSLYAIHDTLGTTAYRRLRDSLKKQRLTNVGSGSAATRTVSCAANCTSSDGWFVDFPDSGERVNVDIRLQLGTIVVATNVPSTSACVIGGYSWINYFDFRNGAPVVTSTGSIVGQRLADSLAVGLNIVRLPSGKTVVIATNSDAKQRTVDVPFDTPAPTGRRISWRELSQ